MDEGLGSVLGHRMVTQQSTWQHLGMGVGEKRCDHSVINQQNVGRCVKRNDGQAMQLDAVGAWSGHLSPAQLQQQLQQHRALEVRLLKEQKQQYTIGGLVACPTAPRGASPVALLDMASYYCSSAIDSSYQA